MSKKKAATKAPRLPSTETVRARTIAQVEIWKKDLLEVPDFPTGNAAVDDHAAEMIDFGTRQFDSLLYTLEKQAGASVYEISELVQHAYDAGWAAGNVSCVRSWADSDVAHKAKMGWSGGGKKGKFDKPENITNLKWVYGKHKGKYGELKKTQDELERDFRLQVDRKTLSKALQDLGLRVASS